MILLGAADIGILANTVYLAPGFTSLAGTGRLGFLLDREHAFMEMQVKHNTPGISAVNVTYTVKVDGSNTSMSVVLAANAASNSITVEVDIPPHSLVEVVATKAGALLTGVLNTIVTIKEIST